MNRILLSVCVLLAACGEVVDINSGDGDGGAGDDASSGPDAGPVDPCAGPSIALEDIASCFVKSQCEFLVRCLPGFPDADFCESRAFDFLASIAGPGGEDDGAPNELFFDIIARADAAGVASYDGVRAYNCLRSFEDKACKDDNNVPDCEYIITGSLAAGQPCTDDFQCMEGGHCNRESDFSCDDVGVCEAGLGLGVQCAGGGGGGGGAGGGGCLPELFCAGLTEPRTCENGKQGTSCANSSECDDEFYCNDSFFCVEDKPTGGDCVKAPECPGNEFCIGGKCSAVDTVGDECENYCAGNLYCNAFMLCQDMPGPGADCSAVPSLGVGRCNSVDLVCDEQSGRCDPRLAIGVSCQGSLSRNCSLGSFCESDLAFNNPRCVAPQIDGSHLLRTEAL